MCLFQLLKSWGGGNMWGGTTFWGQSTPFAPLPPISAVIVKTVFDQRVLPVAEDRE